MKKERVKYKPDIVSQAIAGRVVKASGKEVGRQRVNQLLKEGSLTEYFTHNRERWVSISELRALVKSNKR